MMLQPKECELLDRLKKTYTEDLEAFFHRLCDTGEGKLGWSFGKALCGLCYLKISLVRSIPAMVACWRENAKPDDDTIVATIEFAHDMAKANKTAFRREADELVAFARMLKRCGLSDKACVEAFIAAGFLE